MVDVSVDLWPVKNMKRSRDWSQQISLWGKERAHMSSAEDKGWQVQTQQASELASEKQSKGALCWWGFPNHSALNGGLEMLGLLFYLWGNAHCSQMEPMRSQGPFSPGIQRKMLWLVSGNTSLLSHLSKWDTAGTWPLFTLLDESFP